VNREQLIERAKAAGLSDAEAAAKADAFLAMKGGGKSVAGKKPDAGGGPVKSLPAGFEARDPKKPGLFTNPDKPGETYSWSYESKVYMPVTTAPKSSPTSPAPAAGKAPEPPKPGPTVKATVPRVDTYTMEDEFVTVPRPGAVGSGWTPTADMRRRDRIAVAETKGDDKAFRASALDYLDDDRPTPTPATKPVPSLDEYEPMSVAEMRSALIATKPALKQKIEAANEDAVRKLYEARVAGAN
jgi:hypothetical protein